MILYWKINAFIFGALIGSFLNVVILRMPKNESVVLPKSACPKCGFKLRWFHNIPILSFLFLKGKCASCGVKISWQYPIIEFVTACFSVLLFPNQLVDDLLIYYLLEFTIFCTLLCHFVIDIREKLLLDKLNLFLLAIFIPLTVLNGKIGEGIIGAAVGFLFPLTISWLYFKLRGIVGLGGGDIKLFGVLGFILGYQGIIYNIFFSCALGAIFSLVLIWTKRIKYQEALAFGPFIILVSFAQIYFSDYFNQFIKILFT